MENKIGMVKIPALGDNGHDVKLLQIRLNIHGVSPILAQDGVFGPKTQAAVAAFQKEKGLQGTGVIGPVTMGLLGFFVEEEKPAAPSSGESKAPWFWEAKKYEGKKETDPAFQAKLGGMWAKAGLPSYKGLVGSARAWCALFVLANLSWAGYSYKGLTAAAKSGQNLGHDLDWKKDGFPQGAVVWINATKCGAGSGNHITFANGDCAASDLLKAGATFSGFGGNQGNAAKVSSYSASKICSVNWPSAEADGTPVAKPGPVLSSKNCSNGKTDSGESTR